MGLGRKRSSSIKNSRKLFVSLFEDRVFVEQLVNLALKFGDPKVQRTDFDIFLCGMKIDPAAISPKYRHPYLKTCKAGQETLHRFDKIGRGFTVGWHIQRCCCFGME